MQFNAKRRVRRDRRLDNLEVGNSNVRGKEGLRAVTSYPLNSLQRMPRVLSRPYAERDVEDVESYVRDTVGSISPYMASQEREELVARGIMLVSRMARALPPEVSLEALLHERLGNSLAVYRWRGARRRTPEVPLVSHHAA